MVLRDASVLYRLMSSRLEEDLSDDGDHHDKALSADFHLMLAAALATYSMANRAPVIARPDCLVKCSSRFLGHVVALAGSPVFG